MRVRGVLNNAVCFCVLLTASVVMAAETSDETLLKKANVATDGPGLLDFFRKRTLDGGDQDNIQKLIDALGDDDFETREKASAQLAALGARARPLLKTAAASTDVEVARRATECLQKINEGSGSQTLSAATRLLGQRKPDQAVLVLLAFLPSADDELVAEEVRNTLGALALKNGTPDPDLLAALADKAPVKRAAAAVALCRAKATEQLPAVRKLLQDPVPLVRARTALALAALREKEALPVLIDSLGQVPAYENGTIEDLLYRIAGDQAPTVEPGKDEPGNKKYQAAWKSWWTEHGAQLDLAKLEEASKTLGYTLVVLLDKNKVIELDNANKPRFEIGELDFPLDAQLLPDDHVLVAEHNGNRVTERNKKGEVIWEKKIDEPLAAQRLPNGNTFIASRMQLLEFDKAGKEVFNYSSPRGETFMKATKLRNGDYAFISQLGVSRFVRLSPAGKELSTFAVESRTSGGRVDVTARGHVLIPENGNNRVVECDAAGKIVWEVHIEQPIAAVRLANGNTMVTSMNQNRAVEFDRSGKEVWEYKSDTRVTRALRR